MFSNSITLHNISVQSSCRHFQILPVYRCPEVNHWAKGHECFKVPSIYDKLVFEKYTPVYTSIPLRQLCHSQSRWPVGGSPHMTKPALVGIPLASWGRDYTYFPDVYTQVWLWKPHTTWLWLFFLCTSISCRILWLDITYYLWTDYCVKCKWQNILLLHTN